MSDYVIMKTSGIVRDTVHAKNIKCSKQQVCRMLLHSINEDEEYYLKNNFIQDKFVESNVDIVKDNEIIVDKCVLKRDSSNHYIFMSTKDNTAYNIATMEYIPIESIIQKSSNLQQVCRTILGVGDEYEIYPKSKRVKNLLEKHNLAVVIDDKITIDGCNFKRFQPGSNLFISKHMKIFDISTFNLRDTNDIDVSDFQQIGKSKLQLPINAEVDVHPIILDETNPLKCEFGIIYNDEFILNGIKYVRHPDYCSLFVSNEFKVFDISMFKFISDDTGDILRNITPQRLAQLFKHSTKLFYPKSLTIRNIYKNMNLLEAGDRITINNVEYTKLPNDDDLYLSSNLKLFNIQTFTLTDYNVNDAEMTGQALAQFLKHSTKLFYPKSLTMNNIYKDTNLLEVYDNTININNTNFMKLPDSDDLYISNNKTLFNIRSFKIVDNTEDILKEITPQKFAQLCKKSSALFYPKSLTINNIYKDANLVEVTSNVVNINNTNFMKLPDHDDLYISDDMKIFDIQSFKITNDAGYLIKDMTPQTLAKIILQTYKEVYPNSVTIGNIYKQSNLREIKDNYIHINNVIYTRHPHVKNIFVSSKLSAFDIDTFTFTTCYIDELTNQELAHFIVITEHKLYPKNIEGVTNILVNENLVPLRDDEMEIIIDDNILYRDKLNANIFQSKSGFISFNLDTFDLKKDESKNYNIQQHARDILTTNEWTFPASTNRLNLLTKGNLRTIINDNDLTYNALINNVQMKQHPCFLNILGSKNGKIFDMKTFKFIDNPDIKFTLPFLKSNYGTITIDSEHVFHHDTMTINNHEVNWSNILEGKTISELRYMHPKYGIYFVNFYGKPFKIEVNVETEAVKYKPIRILASGMINIQYHGITLSIKAEKFAYECFHNELTDNIVTILINKAAYNEFRYCKWNLQKSDQKDQADISHFMIHPNPKYNKYAYDVDTNKVYSFFGTNGGQYIKSYRNFVRITDRSLPFRNQRTYPLVKFIYECTTRNIVDDDDFIINNRVIKYGTPSFEMNEETFVMSDKDKHFYRNTDKTKYFYTTYNDFIPCIDGQLILKKSGPVTKDITDIWDD